MYNHIENLLDGPYIELFARTKRKGWDCWGNQTDKFWYAIDSFSIICYNDLRFYSVVIDEME